MCCIQGFSNEYEFIFTEINCRPSATLILTTESGINMPELVLQLAKGEQLNPIENFRLVRIIRYLSEGFYDI